MKVTQILDGGKLSIEFEAGNQKEIFEQLASNEEIFQERCCEACKGTSVRRVVRVVGKYKYFELHCQNLKCRARLAFGQHETGGGTLFPKRKNKPTDTEYLPNNGWVKFDPNAEGEDGEDKKGKAKK